MEKMTNDETWQSDVYLQDGVSLVTIINQDLSITHDATI
jgi:hypothetical protein